MKNTRLSRSEIVDPSEEILACVQGRDCSRTPMLWSSKEYAGFTKGRPWLPVDSDYKKLNVKAQTADRYSMLNLYRILYI